MPTTLPPKLQINQKIISCIIFQSMCLSLPSHSFNVNGAFETLGLTFLSLQRIDSEHILEVPDCSGSCCPYVCHKRCVWKAALCLEVWSPRSLRCPRILSFWDVPIYPCESVAGRRWCGKKLVPICLTTAREKGKISY